MSSGLALGSGQGRRAITAAPPLKGFFLAEGGNFRFTLGAFIAVGIDEAPSRYLRARDSVTRNELFAPGSAAEPTNLPLWNQSLTQVRSKCPV
jgi:hypothetical protein